MDSKSTRQGLGSLRTQLRPAVLEVRNGRLCESGTLSELRLRELVLLSEDTDHLGGRKLDANDRLCESLAPKCVLNRELTEEVVDTAVELAEGERRRFEVGASNLIFVNLREQRAESP
jgi:hypothetical protein